MITVYGGAAAESPVGAVNQANVDSSHGWSGFGFAGPQKLELIWGVLVEWWLLHGSPLGIPLPSTLQLHTTLGPSNWCSQAMRLLTGLWLIICPEPGSAAVLFSLQTCSSSSFWGCHHHPPQHCRRPCYRQCPTVTRLFGLFPCIIYDIISSSPCHLHCPGSGCHPAPWACCFHLLAMLLAASLLSYIMWRLILKLSADGISPSTNIHWLPIAYRIKCRPFCWLIVHHDWALIDLSLFFFLVWTLSFHVPTTPVSMNDLELETAHPTDRPNSSTFYIHLHLFPTGAFFVGRGTLLVPPHVYL